ncbi:MAG TPA: S41 family peptidase [Gemmatimonadales bacterium]|nr:S41 family peptidase [Gemmatimonadales bacterium]
MKQRWGLILAVACISFFSGGWLLQRGVTNDGGVYQSARLFDDVLGRVQSYYVDSIGEAALYQKATVGMLEELHDPYTDLLQGDNYKALTETTTGNYGGLGIQIEVRAGWITVVAPLPDTPAERAGIQTGDQITAIDGTSTQDYSSEKAVSTLRGPAGTDVVLTVRRAGVDAPIEFKLTRAQIHNRSVISPTLFSGHIGYLALSTVSQASTSELRSGIDSLRGLGATSLILDLRGNPGGLLDEGVDVSDLFLDPGQEVVSTRGRAAGTSETYSDTKPQAWPGMPIVVLVDMYSASAAEIIAGALQDHDRALVVGLPTFGKGLVQSVFRIDQNTALKLTTARWYTPSGRTIQRTAADERDQIIQAMLAARNGGIVPDSVLEAKGDSLKLPEFKTDDGRIVLGGGGIVPDIIVQQDTFTTAERDFRDALGAKIPAYFDVMTTYALELKNAGTLKSPDFVVTPAMRNQVYTRLRAKGVDVSEATFNGASRWIDSQLGYVIARYVFGRSAEFQRRAADDPQVQTALGLLTKASTPKALLSLAPAHPVPAGK